MAEQEVSETAMVNLPAKASEKLRTSRVTNPDPSPNSRDNSMDGSAEPEQHDGSDESSDDPDNDSNWVEEPDSDEEQLSFKSFFDEKCFGTLLEMVSYDRKEHGFDLPRLLSEFKIRDTVTLIKVVNMIRSCSTQDLENAEAHIISSLHLLAEDKFMKPVIDDDAVLIHADELVTFMPEAQDIDELSLTHPGPHMTDLDQLSEYSHDKLVRLVSELVVARDEAVLALRNKTSEYEHLAAQFHGQRELVGQVLDREWGIDDPSELDDTDTGFMHGTFKRLEKVPDLDAHYYDAYAHHHIHELMLADKIRTNGYRDFVYGKKHLFAGKVVLDVGCGTGILSLFCAKAGAKHVYAVDNAVIVSKAKLIVDQNGFKDMITCIHGKVEHITLPEKVDIIISEWMGYGLLYEAMLDSVLVAKQRFLAKDGLMVPSHTKLFIAPFSDPGIAKAHQSSWKSVYGFNMEAMMHTTYDDAHVTTLEPTAPLLSPGFSFHDINMGTAKKPTSPFKSEPLYITITKEAQLTGFCIWFDVIFMTKNDKKPVHDAPKHRYFSPSGDDAVSFSTGPQTPETHWHQVLLVIDYGDVPVQRVQEGDVIVGRVEYKVPKDNDRDIDIEMEWCLEKEGSIAYNQEWHLR